MKKIIICLATAIAFAFTACEEVDHAEGMKTTYYPVWELDGGSLVAHQVGSAFTDPGFTATLDGEDVSADVVVGGSVGGNTSGLYTLTYSYTNPDGFSNSISRTVAVYDVANAGTADISGTYPISNCSFFRADGSLARDWNQYGGYNYAQTITSGPATGLFYVQDLYAGFYQYYYGYGAGYAFRALVLLNADNTISILNGGDIDPWGDYIADHAEPSTYNPATGEVVINWDWAYYEGFKCTTTYSMN